MKTDTIKQKEDYLKKLGFQINDVIIVDGYDTEYEVNYGNKLLSVFYSHFKIGDSIDDILLKANHYSCCGDILERETIECPTCKEKI